MTASALACREMAAFWLPLLLPAALVLVISWWQGWILSVVLAGTVLMLWASFVIHEVGHVSALRVLAPRLVHAAGLEGAPDATLPAAFAVDGVGAGVHRPRLVKRWRECLVILAGPLLPVLLWALGLVLLGSLGVLVPAMVVWTGVVAWGHPVALLFPVGDGRALFELFRPNRRA